MMWIHHHLVNYFPIDGHTLCFQFFVTTENAAVKVFYACSYVLLSSFLRTPGGEITGAKICIFFLLKLTARLFSQWTVPNVMYSLPSLALTSIATHHSSY